MAMYIETVFAADKYELNFVNCDAATAAAIIVAAEERLETFWGQTHRAGRDDIIFDSFSVRHPNAKWWWLRKNLNILLTYVSKEKSQKYIITAGAR